MRVQVVQRGRCIGRVIFDMKIQYDSSIKDDKRTRLENEVPDFYEIFEPIEKVIYLLMDKVTGAVFCECHVSAKNLINNCTVGGRR